MSPRAATLLTALLAASGARAFGPFGSERHPVTREASFRPGRAARQASSFFRLSYEFYRRVVSPADGARCAHRPSCSRYALLAVEEHGLTGMLLAMDRLLRGGDSSAVRRLRLVEDGGHLYFLDPLEESTFWFTPP